MKQGIGSVGFIGWVFFLFQAYSPISHFMQSMNLDTTSALIGTWLVLLAPLILLVEVLRRS